MFYGMGNREGPGLDLHLKTGRHSSCCAASATRMCSEEGDWMLTLVRLTGQCGSSSIQGSEQAQGHCRRPQPEVLRHSCRNNVTNVVTARQGAVSFIMHSSIPISNRGLSLGDWPWCDLLMSHKKVTSLRSY